MDTRDDPQVNLISKKLKLLTNFKFKHISKALITKSNNSLNIPTEEKNLSKLLDNNIYNNIYVKCYTNGLAFGL